MDYVSTFYDNFDALLEGDHQTATLLLKELDLDESDIGTKPWMDDVLIVYPDVEEYAVYEFVDGWYQNHNLGGSFDGAPNPIEYIDLTDFGGDLISEGDASIVRLLPNGKVVTTVYGW